jgi:hypothetical protein
VKAVGYRVRCLLRAQWRQALVLSLVVAAITGAVLVLAAGAERTSSAPDRYTAASGIGFAGTVQQERGRPRTAEVAALPGVASVEAVTFVFGGLALPDEAPTPDALVFAGSLRAFGMRIVAGRDPDPSRPDEFVATRSFVGTKGVTVGTKFNLLTLTQDQADRAGFDAAATEGLRGPSSAVTLVGVVDGPAELDDPTPFAAVAPSLLDRGPGVAATIMSVSLRPGTDLSALRAELDSLPDGQALSLEPAEVVSSEVRTAVEGQARGFWLLTAVAGLAGIVVLGQLITRSVRLSTEEGTRLAALGFNKVQLVAESAGRAGVSIVAGTVLGIAVAVSFSSTFPTGFVRRLEPHPGMRLNAAILIPGGACIAVALILWTVASVLMGWRHRGPERPSELVEWVGVRCRGAPSSTGFRFAFTRSRRDRGSVRATITGMVVTVALLVASVVFGSSLARLVVDGDRFGNNFDLFFGTGGEVVPDELVARLEGDADIAALMLYGPGQARIGSVTLGLAGLAPVKGDLGPKTLSGRLPSADDEIALGRLAAKALGAEVGKDLNVEAEGGALRFRVTGLVVVPPVEGLDGVGQGAVVTMGGLRHVDPEVTPSSAAVTLRNGAPEGTAQRLGLGGSDRPGVITNLARIRFIPYLLAGLVGALAVLTVVHVMITSVLRRRRDLALLRSLGADDPWITRAVHWQATSFSLVPLALGLPLGLIAGRLVFRLFADSVGAVPSASFPYALLIAVIAAFVVLANAVAAVPAHRARRLAPAPLLTTE